MSTTKKATVTNSGRKTVDTTKYVVAVGNAFEGVTLYGPFGAHSTAMKYAEHYVNHDAWHIIPITKPTT